MLRRLALTLAAVLVTTGCLAETGDREEVGEHAEAASSVTAAEIDAYWKGFHDDDIAKEWHSDNEGRAWAGDYLAWHESFVEQSLVDMYVATKDVAFTDELVDRMHQVLALRDDQIGRKDEVRGKVMKAWGRWPDVGTNQRTGTWVAEMQQNGVITGPMAEFVRIATHSKTLLDRYGKDRIDHFRDALVETVDAFDDDWDDGGDTGFYRFPNGYSKVYPPFEGMYLHYNRPLSLGATMMMLEGGGIGDAKAQKYRERVRKMARFFLHRVAGPADRAVWSFATFNPAIENTAHGSIDARFIALAGQRDYTSVGPGDVDRFLGTFRNMTRHSAKIATEVDGNFGGDLDEKDAKQSCGRWLDLAAHDAKLVHRCEGYVADGLDTEEVGYAKILRYRP